MVIDSYPNITGLTNSLLLIQNIQVLKFICIYEIYIKYYVVI